MDKEEYYQKYRNFIGTLCDLKSIKSLLEWDQETNGLPKIARANREKQLSSLVEVYQNRLKSYEMKKFLFHYTSPEIYEDLNIHDRAILKYWKHKHFKAIKIPTKISKHRAGLFVKSQQIWIQAKNNNDFNSFAPTLAKIIDSTRKVANFINSEISPYDTLLDDFEPGMTTYIYDKLFYSLKKDLIELLKYISLKTNVQQDKYKFDFMQRPVKGNLIKEFINRVLKDIGFDFEKGMIGYSEHPSTLDISSPFDVRITIDRIEETITLNNALHIFFSAIHEAGHAIYEMNLEESLTRTGINGGTMALHESQSRMWENIIGRGKPFWIYYFGILKEYFPDALEDVSLDHFYLAINTVKPSLIRVEADELTYNLHIMLRYEIEKYFMNSEEKPSSLVKKLPPLWSEKMQEYIDILPDNDSEGILQDIHWSSTDGIGYFPSYTLGNLISAQIYNKILKDIPNLEKEIASGNIKILTQWLTNHLYKNGKIDTPGQIIENITEESLDSKYFIQYINKKYRDLYQ